MPLAHLRIGHCSICSCLLLALVSTGCISKCSNHIKLKSLPAKLPNIVLHALNRSSLTRTHGPRDVGGLTCLQLVVRGAAYGKHTVHGLAIAAERLDIFILSIVSLQQLDGEIFGQGVGCSSFEIRACVQMV